MIIKRLLIILLALITNISCFGQIEIIKTTVNKKQIKGIVFKHDYNHFINKKKIYFTPTPEQIFKAEIYLKDKMENDLYPYKRFKAYKKWKRQYFGYMKDGKQIIQIALLRITLFNRIGKFKGWKKDVIYGSGSFFEKNLWVYSIEIDSSHPLGVE